MNATVVHVDTRAKAGRYDCTDLVVNTDRGERTFKVFKQNEQINDVNNLVPGKEIDIKLEKSSRNGKDYWNFDSFTEVQGSASRPASSSSVGLTRDSYWQAKFDHEQESIPRAVALKAAVDIANKEEDASPLVKAQIAGEIAPLLEEYLREGFIREISEETKDLVRGAEEDPFDG